MNSKQAVTENEVFMTNLKEVLDRRNLTQKAVAEICEVSPSIVNGWMTGSLPKNMQPILRLCQSLKIDFQWLLTNTRSSVKPEDMDLEDIFEIEDDPLFSGLFLLEGKRLKRKTNRKG